MGYLRGPEGGKSSKRLMGIISGIVGLLIAVMSIFHFADASFDTLILVFSYSLGMFGITGIEKFKPQGITPPDDDPPPGKDPEGDQ